MNNTFSEAVEDVEEEQLLPTKYTDSSAKSIKTVSSNDTTCTGRKRWGGPEGVTVSYKTQDAQHDNRLFCELFSLSNQSKFTSRSQICAS